MTRREWCASLAVMVSPSFPAEAQAALNLMLPAMQHVPDGLFSEQTVLVIAGRKRRQSVPAWDEIKEGLNEFRRDNQTQFRALPPPEGSDLTAMDRSWLAFWHKRKAEIWAQQTDFHWKTRDADLANLASLIRQESPKAWREISGAEPARHTPTEREIAAVADTLRKFRDKTPKSAMPEEKPARPEPRYLSDAELERVREARRVAP